MDRMFAESDELGTTILKKQIDYLDNCKKKFEKKVKILNSKKRDIIENILIWAFNEFLSISESENIDDECTVRIYFYIQGLRHSIRTEETLEEVWNKKDKITSQVIDMLKTFAFYLNNNKVKRKIRNLMKQINILYIEKTGIDLVKYIVAPKPVTKKEIVKDSYFRKILKHFIKLEIRYCEVKSYPLPKLINSIE